LSTLELAGKPHAAYAACDTVHTGTFDTAACSFVASACVGSHAALSHGAALLQVPLWMRLNSNCISDIEVLL